MVELSTISSGPKRHRVSDVIQRKPIGNLYHAPRIAQAAGTPLNTFVTINFAHTDCRPELASAVFEKLRNTRFGPWIHRPPRGLRRNTDPCAYAWVLENPGTLNAHWLLHLPPDRSDGFQARVEHWLRAVGVAVHNDQAVQVVPAPSPIGLVYYFMKGANPAYAQFYGIKSVSPQGKIVGKRSGVSRSLGPTRKAALRDAGLYRRTRRMSLEGFQLSR